MTFKKILEEELDREFTDSSERLQLALREVSRLEKQLQSMEGAARDQGNTQQLQAEVAKLRVENTAAWLWNWHALAVPPKGPSLRHTWRLPSRSSSWPMWVGWGVAGFGCANGPLSQRRPCPTTRRDRGRSFRH